MKVQLPIVSPKEAQGRFCPLKLRYVMTALGLSTRSLGGMVGLSAASISMLASSGYYPKRKDRTALRGDITRALTSAGATPAQLDHLFEHYDPEQARRLGYPPLEEEDSMLTYKHTLSDAARRQFGLFANPFDGEVTCAEEMFLTGEIRFAREAMWQTAVNARFAAVLGESGAGKSTILGDLKERIVADRRQVVLIEPSVVGMEDSDISGKTMKAADITTAIVMTLDPADRVARTSEQRMRQAQRLLELSSAGGTSHLLVIEEAHSLPTPTLNHLKRLHERMRMGRKPMLGILLLAHTDEMLKKLHRHATREVMQRCELATLPPLDGNLRAYLEHRAKAAGRKLEEFITHQGVDELRTRLTVESKHATKSQLYPLNVNNWMTGALNMAAALGAPLVDADVIRAV